MARPARQGPLIAFRLYAPLTEEMARQGHDVLGLLERTGVPVEVLTDTDTRIPFRTLDALWDGAIETTGDPLLPLRVGLSVRPDALGFVRYLVTAAETGVDAVERASSVAGYFGDDAHVTVRFERGLAVLLHGRRPEAELSRPVCEYGVAMTVALSREMGSETDVGEAVEARFQGPEPAHAKEYEAILGLPVRFGCSHDGASFRLATLQASNPRADPVLRKLLEEHADQLLARLPREDSFAERVRNCIAERLPDGAPGVEDVARLLKMSARTLRRRLADEDTSFRDVLDDVRHALALEHLGRDGMSVEEVAYRLGFSDASAFHKAFRRWTGKRPADYASARGAG